MTAYLASFDREVGSSRHLPNKTTGSPNWPISQTITGKAAVHRRQTQCVLRTDERDEACTELQQVRTEER